MKRARGAGTIYKRGEIWWVKISVDGRSVYQSSKSTKLEDAQRLRDQLIAKRLRRELGGKPDKVLIGDLLDDALKSDIQESTRKGWGWVIEKNLRPFFGHLKAERLTTDMIEDYRERRVCQGISQATANRELTILRSAFSKGSQRTPPKVYRVPYFPMQEETNIRTGFLADEFYLKLKEALPEPEVKLLFVISYHMGLRKNELLQIKWREVDLNQGYIHLTSDTTKTGEGRQVPILEGDMHDLLVEAKRFRDENFPSCPWVFHRSGKQVLNFRSVWSRATTAVGVPDLLFHDLRRTAVRNMRRNGVSQAVRMKISGHKTDSMERRYNIVDGEDLEDAKRLMSQPKT